MTDYSPTGLHTPQLKERLSHTDHNQRTITVAVLSV